MKKMNYPAASYGVSIGSYHNASSGGESNLYPPQEGLSAFGGLISTPIDMCYRKPSSVMSQKKHIRIYDPKKGCSVTVSVTLA